MLVSAEHLMSSEQVVLFKTGARRFTGNRQADSEPGTPKTDPLVF